MTDRADKSKPAEPLPRAADQREQLRRSEKAADEDRPENFKDVETARKIVEIGPDMTQAPIEGIDPAERSPGR